MLNSFLSMETASRGLFAQQLTQDVIASNLAKSYRDADGYLISSRQRLNLVEGAPLLFGSATAGRMAVGTGPLVQQITRLRNSFLDTQIQQESSVVGRAEILNDILFQVNTIVNGPAGNLDSAVTDLANAFAALAPNPLNIALRSTVVNNGVAFADMAHKQITQLENLQKTLNGKINGTISQVNSILQQLASVNRELLSHSGVNQNDLLDARDYALDRLGRLINIQVNFGTAGTAGVFLGSSSISLVDGSGASILQASEMNPHNPGLSNVTIQSSQGTFTLKDASDWITGGNLGGELHARDVVLESYKSQVDQIATSVMNVTNILHQSGYAADGVTTGTLFFTGTGAQDINVNGALVADATRALLAAALTSANTADGTVASYLGDIPNLLANNFVTSQPQIGAVNPANPIGGEPFTFPPTAGIGTFTVNGNLVTYDTAVDSVNSILVKINAAAPNVKAVFDSTNQVFYMLSNNPVTIVNLTGNFSGGLSPWANIKNVLTSTIRMNNGFAPGDPTINVNSPNPPGYMNSTYPEVWPPFPGVPITGPNAQAFKVTPGAKGTFTISGSFLPGGQIQISWTNSVSNPSNLDTILAQIATATGNLVTASFNSTTQTIILYQNTPTPFQIIDNVGNFTVFTGLNGNTPIGNLSSGLLTQSATDLSAQQLALGQASASLTQLNNSQADLAGIAFVAGDHGVPFEIEQENALKSLIAFNASLQVLQIIDQMYADLVSIVGGSTNSVLAQRK